MSTNWEQLLGVVVFGLFGVAYLIELLGGHLLKTRRPLRDLFFVIAGMLAQSSLSGVVVATVVGLSLRSIFPGSAGRLADVGFWPSFLVLWPVVEFAHYWLHRWAHKNKWLWQLHRTHHTAIDLNVGVVFRYNVFWTMLLPQAWIGAGAIYFGLAPAFAAATLITFVVNLLTHTSFRWDLWLRERFPGSEPVWRFVERIVTLPDTHHAHHAYGSTGHMNGNYAVTIFAFDVLFGTARIPNLRQTKFGLANAQRFHWADELFWPVVRKPMLPPERSG